MPHTLSNRASFRDRFGERDAVLRTDGEPCARLRFSSGLVATNAAIEARIEQLAAFDRTSVSRALRLEADPETGQPTLISDYVPGPRLSEVLRQTSARGLIPDLAAGLFVVRRLLATTERARAATGVAYFAIAPERIVVTPRAEVVVVEAALTADIEARARSTDPELGPQEDIAHIARIGLSMVLGRLITEEQYLDPLSPELGEMADVAAIRANEDFATALRLWMEQALVTDRRLAFPDLRAARTAFDATNTPNGKQAPSRASFSTLLSTLSLEELRAGEALVLEAARVRAVRTRMVDARWNAAELGEDILAALEHASDEAPQTSLESAAPAQSDDDHEDGAEPDGLLTTAAPDGSNTVEPDSTAWSSALVDAVHEEAAVPEPTVAGYATVVEAETTGPEVVEAALEAPATELVPPEPSDEESQPAPQSEWPRLLEHAQERQQEAPVDDLTISAVAVDAVSPGNETTEPGDTGDTDQYESEETATESNPSSSWLRRAFERARDYRAKTESEPAEAPTESAMMENREPDSSVEASRSPAAREDDPWVQSPPSIAESEEAWDDTPQEADELPQRLQQSPASENEIEAADSHAFSAFWHTEEDSEEVSEAENTDRDTESPPAPSSAWIHDLFKHIHEDAPASDVTDQALDEPPDVAESNEAAIEADEAEQLDGSSDSWADEAEQLGGSSDSWFEESGSLTDDQEDPEDADSIATHLVSEEPEAADASRPLWFLEAEASPEEVVHPETATKAPAAATAKPKTSLAGWLARLFQRRTRSAPDSAADEAASEIKAAFPQEAEPSSLPGPPPQPWAAIASIPEVPATESAHAARQAAPPSPLPGRETTEATAAEIASAHLNKESERSASPTAPQRAPDPFAYLDDAPRRGSGRARMVASLLVLAGLGYGGYAYRDRLPLPVTGFTGEAANAVTTAAVDGAAAPTVGSLTVASTPPGARVNVDGRHYGVTPLTVPDLEPGNHTVLLENTTGTVRRQVAVTAGDVTRLDEAIFAGFVAVFAPFELQVYAGGQQIGTTDNPRIMLPPGRHDLDLVNARLGFRESRRVNIEPGETVALNIQPAEGQLRVIAPAGASVLVDGEPVGQAPVGDLTLRIGTHEIVVRHPEFGERRVTTAVKPGATTDATVDFMP